MKAEGHIIFKSQVIRDLACLFDVDADVASWRTPSVDEGDEALMPPFDFIVSDHNGYRSFVDAPDRSRRRDKSEALREASAIGYGYRGYSVDDIYFGYRLENARDLLRYGNYEVGLNDRVRLLAALDENGSLTVAECLMAFQEIKPMAGLASLILRGFVSIELDDELIGPQTAVRRIAA